MHYRKGGKLKATFDCSQSKIEELRSELEEAKGLIEEQWKFFK